MDISIIIVNYNSGKLLEKCLDSICTEESEIEFETFVVDNGSSDDSWKMIKEMFPQVSLIRNADNLGFSRANNQAIRRSLGRYLLLLNPDTILRTKALEKMVHFMDEYPRAGAAGPKLIDPQGTIQLSCRSFPSHRTALFNRYSLLTKLLPANRFSREYLMTGWDHSTVQEVDWVSGACLLMRKEALDEIGLLDERFFMYAEDVDWCYRAKRRGWKVYFIPQAEVVHYIGQSSRRAGRKAIVERHRSMYRFYQKHYRRNLLLDGLTAAGIAMRAGFLLAMSLIAKRNAKCAKELTRG